MVGPRSDKEGVLTVKTVGERLGRLWLILRELGRIPEYQEEAERLYRQSRASGGHPAARVERGGGPPPGGGGRGAGIPGLAGLTGALYLVGPPAGNGAPGPLAPETLQFP